MTHTQLCSNSKFQLMAEHRVVCQASAPGKVILCGEHAVVHGTRAVAAAIDRRTEVLIVREEGKGSCFRLRMSGMQLDGSDVNFCWKNSDVLEVFDSIEDHLDCEKPSDFVSRMLDEFVSTRSQIASEFFRIDGNQYLKTSAIVLLHLAAAIRKKEGIREFIPGVSTLELQVNSNLPLGAGLGSSASFCTAVVACLLKFARINNSESAVLDSNAVNAWSFFGESIIHGTPSGVDNSVSSFGGAIVYQRLDSSTSMKHIDIKIRIPVLIVNTRVHRNTKEQVRKVRELFESFPNETQLKFDAIDDISGKIIHLLSNDLEDVDNFVESIQPLFSRNELLLEELGVGHPAISRVLSIFKNYNIPGKLTGAGGGGCVVAILTHKQSIDEEFLESISLEMQDEGFDCFQASIEPVGVIVS